MHISMFHIVIPTQLTISEFHKSDCYKCLQEVCSSNDYAKTGCDYRIVPFCENKIGLSELYQSYLDGTEIEDADYVIFMHDDLVIHDHFVFKKLINAHQTYDIVGLAGATSQDYTKSGPPVWHLAMDHPSDGRGFVSHFVPKGFNGAPEPYVNSAYFGPSPSPVVVIDGLFISIKLSSIFTKDTDDDLRYLDCSMHHATQLFDKEFTFHHYDLSFAWNAHDHDLSMGVCPIFCIHAGLGEFRDDNLWQDLAKRFKAKYGHYKNKV